jgi:hypothetical protein
MKALIFILILLAAVMFALNWGIHLTPQFVLLGILAVVILVVIRSIGRTWLGAIVLLLIGLILFAIIARAVTPS